MKIFVRNQDLKENICTSKLAIISWKPQFDHSKTLVFGLWKSRGIKRGGVGKGNSELSLFGSKNRYYQIMIAMIENGRTINLKHRRYHISSPESKLKWKYHQLIDTDRSVYTTWKKVIAVVNRTQTLAFTAKSYVCSSTKATAPAVEKKRKTCIVRPH